MLPVAALQKFVGLAQDSVRQVLGGFISFHSEFIVSCFHS